MRLASPIITGRENKKGERNGGIGGGISLSLSIVYSFLGGGGGVGGFWRFFLQINRDYLWGGGGRLGRKEEKKGGGGEGGREGDFE